MMPQVSWSLILLMCTLSQTYTFADDVTKEERRYKESMDQLESAFREQLRAISEKYVKGAEAARDESVMVLSKQRDAAAMNVNLELANRIQSKIDDLESLKFQAPVSDEREVIRLKARLSRLEQRGKRKAKGRAEDKPRTVFDETVQVTARSPIGYSVGAVQAGDTLTLSYVKGRWKGWGGHATESPDSDNPSSPKAHTRSCRLCIGAIDRNSAFRGMATVPHGTAKKPFVWKVPLDADQLILRICGDMDGKYDRNPDTGVFYELKIER